MSPGQEAENAEGNRCKKDQKLCRERGNRRSAYDHENHAGNESEKYANPETEDQSEIGPSFWRRQKPRQVSLVGAVRRRRPSHEAWPIISEDQPEQSSPRSDVEESLLISERHLLQVGAPALRAPQVHASPHCEGGSVPSVEYARGMREFSH